MSLGQIGGGILAGPNKIGDGYIRTLVAGVWQEVVLQSLNSNPRPYPRNRWSIVALGNIFMAQANSALTIAQQAYSLPADPSIVTTGNNPGYAFLLANTYMTFEAERTGENSLWLFSKNGCLVYLTDLGRVEFDN